MKGAGAAVTAGIVSAAAAGFGDVNTTAGTPTESDVSTPSSGDGARTTRTSDEDRSVETPVIGANLNGRPHRLDDAMGLLDASDTTWVRAFLDVRQKLRAGSDPQDDPDVVALRRAAREEDCKLVVSLKWDFKANWGDKEPMRVPRPGSRLERELFGTALQCLESIGDAVEVVVLGNEPMWETLDADVKVEDPPIVQFTRNAKEHLVRRGDLGDPTYLVGAFNRGHDDHVREQFSQFYRSTSEFVREDDDVDGVDLHLHYDDFSEAEDMVATAREAFPGAVITATEFSPVFRYWRYLDTPITAFDAGETFARDHDLPATMTAVEYFEHAKRNPRPPEEVADFYDAMPWYNVDHVEDMYGLFADFDVSIGTFGFLQGVGMRNEDWTANWTPFHINFLYQPAITRTDGGVENTANRHYIEDYRRRAV